MAVVPSPKTKYTAQELFNLSFDQDKSTLAIELLGYDGTNLVRLKTDSNGVVQTNVSGLYAPIGSSFVTISSDPTLTAERVLTGTANQVVITDNGANSTVVLSLPQNIHTGASPTFTGLTLSGLTASLPVVTDGSKALASVSYATLAGNIDHGLLIGLTDDDHTQYALLAGRSGGQTLIGGTAASNNLTLQSSSNATRGNIVMSDAVGLAAGTVSLPSLAFSDNLDTGIYEPTTGSSGTLGITVNGTQSVVMAASDNWGWHNTAVATANVITSTISTNLRSKFMVVDMTRTGIGGVTLSVLDFTYRTTSDLGMIIGKATIDVQRNNPNKTFIGWYTTGGLNAANTMASGTVPIYGFEFAPSNAGAATVTGGTLTFVGLRWATIPTNYAGGGATTYFRGTYFGDNIGSAYGNSEAAPDLIISSDGTNGIMDFTTSLRINEAGASVDTVVEGDTDTNLLFVDASADTVQVGAATVSDSAKFYVSGKISTSGEMEINGDLNHDGTNVGFYGVAPVARSSTYTASNVTTDRSYDANSTSIDEVADVLGTLITDLKATGIIG